jgi:hypothetical protein
VLIARCAWHPRKYGHGKLLGVISWRGARVDYTDGICRKCAAGVQVPLRQVPGPRPAPAPAAPTTSEVVVVALAIMTGLVLIARPANEGSMSLGAVNLLPRPVLMADTAPGLAVTSHPPRRPRPQPPGSWPARVRASVEKAQLQSP